MHVRHRESRETRARISLAGSIGSFAVAQTYLFAPLKGTFFACWFSIDWERLANRVFTTVLGAYFVRLPRQH